MLCYVTETSGTTVRACVCVCVMHWVCLLPSLLEKNKWKEVLTTIDLQKK